MSTNSALVVLLPVYNNQRGLEHTLLNLDGQPERFDVLVVDDGSVPPMSIPVGLSPAHLVRLKRLASNLGIARALNEGLALLDATQYRYVARIDAGDEAVNGRFSKQVAFLDANPRCAAVSSFIDFFDPSGETAFRFEVPTVHRDILRGMYWKNCLVHAGTTLRLDSVKANGVVT